MDERRRRAWEALELGPLWVARDAPESGEAAAAPPGLASGVIERPGGAEDSAGVERSVGVEASILSEPAVASEPSLVAGPAFLAETSSGAPGDPFAPDRVSTEPAEPADAPAGGPIASAIERLEAIRVEAAGCPRCRLSQSRTQVVFGTGNPAARWMLVGEAPGAEEDLRGEPFVGQAGRLLDAMLAALGLRREEHVYICNVLKCRPPNNRNPQPDEVAACAPYLREQLALVAPRLVIALGRFAAQSLLGTTASIASLRGKAHRLDTEGGPVPVVVTYHPAYLLRDRLTEKALVWQDLCLARATVPPIGEGD